MSQIAELVKNGKYREAIGIPEESLSGRDLFFLLSSYLSLNDPKSALEVISRHRRELYETDPLMTLKANFEIRFALKQFDEAEQDLDFFANEPYVSQEVEEALRDLPRTIAATRFASTSSSPDYEKALEVLSSPSDDLMLLSALNALKKTGELEDYRGLVEELLVGPWHDDVKTYALMLLSAKGSTHPTTLIKRGKSYTVTPAKLGTPFAMKEYQQLRKSLEGMLDQSLLAVAGELLDLYALLRYPERFVDSADLAPFLEGLTCLASTYLGNPKTPQSAKGKAFYEEIGKLIQENPPLLQ